MRRNLRMFYLSIPSITVILLLLNNSTTGVLYTIGADRGFSYGPLYILVWTSGILYVLDCLIYLINQKNIMQRRKINLLVFSGLFLVSAAFVHYMIPKLQLLQFTNALLILIIFVEQQSPILNEDISTGALNFETFENYILNLIENDTHILFLHVKNTNISNELSTFSFLPRAYSDIINKLKKALKHSVIFRIDTNTFAITYKTNSDKILASNIVIDELKRIKETTPAALPLRYLFAHTAPLKSFSDRSSFKNAIQWALIKMQDHSVKLDLYITADDAIAFARNRIIDTEIHKVVNNKPMNFNLQPIYNLKTKRFDTAEALARIQVPSLGYVPCDEFIQISEDNGTIVAIGKSMMEEICHVINTIKMPFNNISINISMIHFMEPHIVEDFVSILDRNDIEPSKIILEITESTKAINWEMLKTNMQKLKDIGFKLSLDDFGTGYSTFESFLTLPFDIVKLDRNLLLACETEESKLEVLKTVVKMIKDLNFETVLEGVETEKQNEIAKEIGVDKIQGFYYSRPLDTSGIIRFFKNNMN
jgi:EAL domain-containing protein (putative c-di-GMP-specific phosphodiesterase class I)